jgi:hypothetical protein
MAVFIGSAGRKFTDKEVQQLIKKAHESFARRKGRDYKPKAYEIEAWINWYLSKDKK